MATVTTKHAGIEIEYDEADNKWRFELHGKERVAETLANAKKAIDTQPKEKKDFTPKPAILISGYEGAKEVTITSEAADLDYHKNVQYWVKTKDGKRSKESVTRLFSIGPANQQLLRESIALDKEASLLHKKAEAKRKEMAPFVPSATA